MPPCTSSGHANFAPSMITPWTMRARRVARHISNLHTGVGRGGTQRCAHGEPPTPSASLGACLEADGTCRDDWARCNGTGRSERRIGCVHEREQVHERRAVVDVFKLRDDRQIDAVVNEVCGGMARRDAHGERRRQRRRSTAKRRAKGDAHAYLLRAGMAGRVPSRQGGDGHAQRRARKMAFRALSMAAAATAPRSKKGRSGKAARRVQ